MNQPTQPIGQPPAQPPAPPSRPAIKIEQGAPPRPLRLEGAWNSHPGMARGYNEDALRGTPPDFPAAAQRGFLFLVADGMGGHNAGEVASNESAARIYQRYYEDGDPDIQRSLENAMRRTNAELFNQAQADPQQRGMGTTLTAAVIKDGHLYVAHVGDSRLYLIRNGQPEQVTQDHSWVEEQVRAGVLTRLQAESHPQRNVITRALATAPDVKVEHYERDLQPGDALVLCSDGLNTEVGDAQIAAHATKAASAEDAVKRLIQLANDNGGEDNISVIVIRLGDGGTAASTAVAAAPATAAATGRRKFPLLPVIAGAAGVVLVAALAILIPKLLRAPAAETPPVIAQASPAASVAGAPSATLAAALAPVSGVQLVGTTAVSTASAAGLHSETPPAATGTQAGPTVTLAPTRASETPPKPPVMVPEATKPAATATPGRKPLPPKLVSPHEGDTRSGKVTFEWQTTDPLPADALYEVVMWNEGDDANTTYFGVADPTRGTSLLADLNAQWSLGRIKHTILYWTVLVIKTDPYRPITRPSESVSRQLIYQPPSGEGTTGGGTGK